MSTKEELLMFIAEKEKLEQKISELGNILEANGDVGMNGPLIDDEGYPRNDIDVYQVRQARHQIICLQNDHKDLMKKIEILLHQFHGEARNENQNEELLNNLSGVQINNTRSFSDTAAPEIHKPIVQVNLVSTASPAEEAGIRLGDEIIEFGSVNSTNFKNDLLQIGNLVRHMENQRIPLKVKRDNQSLDLILIPRKWSGRGLLGCNIVLINSE